MLIDSHAHLYFEDFASDLNQILENAKQAGVEKIINIGTNLEDSQQAIDLAHKYEFMFATVGIHPNDDANITAENVDWVKLEKLARMPKVIGIGECGLDYSRIKAKGLRTNDEVNETNRQKSIFKKQIAIAEKFNLPLSIHIRNAQEDIINEFEEELQKVSGVFHCFSGDQKYLDFALSLDSFYVSLAGNITFKNAVQLRDLVKQTPVARMLLETDCPFLAPEPYRGKRNEPGYIHFIADRIAEVKGLSSEEIARITSDNATRLFKL